MFGRRVGLRWGKGYLLLLLCCLRSADIVLKFGLMRVHACVRSYLRVKLEVRFVQDLGCTLRGT